MIANHKGEIPFVILLLPFLAGMIMSLNYGAFADNATLTIVFLLLSAVFIGLNIGYKRFQIYKHRWLGGVLIHAILFLFGWISIAKYSELNKQNHFAKTPAQYLLIKINNEPVLKNGYYRFTGQVEGSVNRKIQTATNGTILISLKDSVANTLRYGEELLIRSNYTAIDPPFNPAEFNYKQYLANQNIYYQQFLFPKQYVVMAHNNGNAIVAYALTLRKKLVGKLKTNMHDPNAEAIASALLLGYRADLSGDVLEAYAKTGTIYVLTVSGAQLAVIYFLLSYLLAFMNRWKYGRLLKAAIMIAILWYYALLTGFSPAVCRAVVVLTVIIIGRTYSRYINTLNLLAVSAFVLLLYDPFYITWVGFQLGYIAVAGLLIFRPVVYKWLKFKNRLANKIWNICSVSIAAQVVTFPLAMFYFHQFPVYFLLSNLLVVVPVAIIMYTGILYLLLPQISFISCGLGYIIEHTILIMNSMLSFIKQLPFAGIDKIWITTTEYILFYAVIISLFYFLYSKKAWLLRLSLICILLLSISISLKKINKLNTNALTFLNLRKHTGIVMKNGSSAVVISDLADTDKNYKYSIQPYLDSSGITNVKLYNPAKSIRSAFMAKQHDLLQFRKTKFLICNGQKDFNQLDTTFKPGYVYITGSPYNALNGICKKQVRQTLVIDGNNSDYFIAALQKQADSLKIKYINLKRNKSLLLVSN